ncbi:MAG: hypothetical protein LLG20_22735 [Acidobacteriales bacterium]|nr:hypothetical protein [Terriglobales bacterium]
MTATNLTDLTARFTAATTAAEIEWTKLRADKFNPRLLARYVRRLRICARLRERLRELMETGNL